MRLLRILGFFVIFVELFSSSLFLRLATKVALCVALERCTALILPAFAWTTWALRVWVVHRLLSFRFQVFSIRVNCCYIRRPLLKIPQWMVTITSERAPTEHQRGTIETSVVRGVIGGSASLGPADPPLLMRPGF